LRRGALREPEATRECEQQCDCEFIFPHGQFSLQISSNRHCRNSLHGYGDGC
jgi:hypothetical protein